MVRQKDNQCVPVQAAKVSPQFDATHAMRGGFKQARVRRRIDWFQFLRQLHSCIVSYCALGSCLSYGSWWHTPPCDVESNDATTTVRIFGAETDFSVFVITIEPCSS